jgi:GntR family transcriptional regulator/MocR family aminotransferase
VIVVGGSQQGLDLAARVLLDSGDAVWMEEPGYPGARAAFAAAGARLVPVPVDDEGLRVEAGERAAPEARLVYVSPSHQYPTGATMSASRRLALLAWAARAGAWVVEDDYDSEFRYASRPLPALQGLDGAGRVVYVGTFSKTLLPALRLGYLVVPDALVDTFRAARAVVDRQSPIVDQAVLAEFLEAGHFARHVRRMRALYAERQAALVEAARHRLDGLLEVRPAGAGMHLVGWLPPGADDARAAAGALAAGVESRALSRCALQPLPRGGLMLGYAAYTPQRIRRAVERLAGALEGGR